MSDEDAVDREPKQLHIRLSPTELMTMKVRIGGTDVQVTPPRPRPKLVLRLDLGGLYVEIDIDQIEG